MGSKITKEEMFIVDLKVALDRYLRDYGASNELINQAIDFQVPELLKLYAAQFKQAEQCAGVETIPLPNDEDEIWKAAYNMWVGKVPVNKARELAGEALQKYRSVQSQPQQSSLSDEERPAYFHKIELPISGNFLHWVNRTAGYYNHPLYLVGSQITGSKTPRDVDIVCPIPDKEFELRFGSVDDWMQQGGTGLWTDVRWKWASRCAKDSLEGMEWTKLQIDFKVQPMAQWNGYSNIHKKFPPIQLDSNDWTKAALTNRQQEEVTEWKDVYPVPKAHSYTLEEWESKKYKKAHPVELQQPLAEIEEYINQFIEGKITLRSLVNWIINRQQGWSDEDMKNAYLDGRADESAEFDLPLEPTCAEDWLTNYKTQKGE